MFFAYIFVFLHDEHRHVWRLSIIVTHQLLISPYTLRLLFPLSTTPGLALLSLLVCIHGTTYLSMGLPAPAFPSVRLFYLLNFLRPCSSLLSTFSHYHYYVYPGISLRGAAVRHQRFMCFRAGSRKEKGFVAASCFWPCHCFTLLDYTQAPFYLTLNWDHSRLF